MDKLTGKLATEFTPAEAIEEKVFKIYPEQYRQWAEEHGIPQPPTDQSDVYTGDAQVLISTPVEGEIVSGVVQVFGSADAPAFVSRELQYGISHEPGAFSPPISGPFGDTVNNNLLGEWDTSGLQDGPHTLRLVVRDQAGTEREYRVRLFITHEVLPPTLEATPTWTVEAPTPTIIALPTDVPPVLPTDTPVVEAPTPLPPTPEPPAPEPTWTLPPVETPIPPVEPPPVEVTATWTPEAGGAGVGNPITGTAPLTDTNSLTGTGIVTGSAVVSGTTQ